VPFLVGMLKWCVAVMCCSVLQCVDVLLLVVMLQWCVAVVCCSVLRRVVAFAACCGALRVVTACCNML